MQVGFEEFAVLVVAGEQSRARELAGMLGGEGSSLGTATATDLGEAVETLTDHAFDGVVVATGDGLDGEGALSSLATCDDEHPVVVLLGRGSDLTPAAALEAGATDVVTAAVGDLPAVLTNRVELALAGAGAARTAREARQRYHRLLDGSPAAIVIFDADGELLYANPAAASVTGARDPHDVVGRSVFDLVADDDEAQFREQFDQLVEGRERVGCEELAIETLDGDTRYVETAVHPVTVAGEPGGQAVLTDVTTLKERERRLRTERDRFTALFQSLPEAAVHVQYHGEEPVVQNVNPAFESVFGYDAEEVVGENLDDYVVPDGQEAEAAAIDATAADGGEIERELERETAEGVREFLFSAKSMETAEGTDEGVGIYVDITERKRREDALERQNERLDAFASIVSHDLKSPLSVANGNLYLAREEDDEAYLDDVEEALSRMERIIEDLLRLARGGEEAVDPEPVDGGRVVTEAWTEVDVEGAHLDNRLDARLLADRSQFRELLGNLIRNSVEHGSTSLERAGDAGEEVTVVVGELAGGDEGATAGDGEGTTGFYVADDGPGIPPEEREDVFEPGYTTHEEGTGFGLVVVEEIARAHGWAPSVTESEAGGARFEFRGVDRA